MIEIRELQKLDLVDFERIESGYVSDRKYSVVHTDSADYSAIELRLTQLSQPYVKKYDFDEATLQRYNAVLKDRFSFGAYEGELLIGFVIGEALTWNSSLWVHEFHVTETHRRAGTGVRLMERVSERAINERLRIIVCETQNTNVPAIEVYRRLGFRIEGIDMSYYANDDDTDGEIAIFMKRRLKLN